MSTELAVPERINFDPEVVEGMMLKMENQVECPVRHLFSPGIYIREMTMPANSIVLGHEHTTEHANLVLKGKAIVLIDGVRHRIEAPFVVNSKPGSRKIALVLEEMVWCTVHATTETDIEKLEAQLIRKSKTFIASSEAKALLESKEKEVTV